MTAGDSVIIYTHKHKVGEYMVQRQFALFPQEIDDQRKAWLQYVYRVSKVQHGGMYTTIKYFLTIGEANQCVKHMQEKSKAPEKWSTR